MPEEIVRINGILHVMVLVLLFFGCAVGIFGVMLGKLKNRVTRLEDRLDDLLAASPEENGRFNCEQKKYQPPDRTGQTMWD